MPRAVGYLSAKVIIGDGLMQSSGTNTLSSPLRYGPQKMAHANPAATNIPTHVASTMVSAKKKPRNILENCTFDWPDITGRETAD